MIVPAAGLKQWASRVLASWGGTEADAAYIADSLVEANLRGIDSHGVIRLPVYHQRVDHLLVDPAAQPIIQRPAPGVAWIDANRAPGQIAARAATEVVGDIARRQGIGLAAVKHSAHFGAAGYYARALAGQGLAAIIMSNSEPIVVPFGGKRAFLGTNPLAMAAPGPDFPVCLDMATSAVAMGKVAVAEAAGQPIPADWCVDQQGLPTTDPAQAAYAQPMAGPKGYGLAFLIEILAGALTGAGMAAGLGNIGRDLDRPQDIGHLFIAIDPAPFGGSQLFAARIADLAAQAHAIPPATPAGEVLLPGEPEERTRAHRLAEGVDIPAATVTQLLDLAKRCGVDAGPFDPTTATAEGANS